MDYLTLTTVTIWIIVFAASPGKSIDVCLSHTCDNSQQPDSLACDDSHIWISDVTSGHQRNETALSMSKQSCMGQQKCDIENICSATRKDPPLIVHYMCVNATHAKTGSCKGRVQDQSGHIQSNGYPKYTQRPRAGGGEYLCSWNISPPNGSLVAITILDISISGKEDECEAGLVVSGQSCEDGNKFAPRILCKGEAGTKLVRCGRVRIKLRRSEKVYPLRFWLSFQVQRIGQSTGSHSTLPCSVNGYNQGNSANSSGAGSTLTRRFENADMANLLIILLSVISGISIVLLVILIVFCARWRTSQYGRSEPLYSYTDISPGLQTHYEYISSLEPETDKSSRPELVDGYFEVADALPITERGETPTSPAYAEVENFPQLRRQALSQESLSSRGASTPDGAAASSFTPRGGAAAASRGSYTDDQADDAGSHSSSVADIPSRGSSVRGARSKRTVLDRLKGVPGLSFGDKEKRLHSREDLNSPTQSSSPKGVTKKSNKVGTPSGTSWQQKIARRFGSRENVVSSPDIPDTASEAGSEPAYESIGEFVPLPGSRLSMKNKFKIGGDQTKPALPTSGPPNRNKGAKMAAKPGTSAMDKSKFSPTSSQSPSVAPGSRKEEFVSKDQKTTFNHYRRSAQTNAASSSPTKLKNAKVAISDLNSSKTSKALPGRMSNSATNKTSPSMPSTDNKNKNDTKNKECSGLQQPEPQGTKNNNYKRNTPKDIPRSKGIVKNGIQLFEQNSSTSNE